MARAAATTLDASAPTAEALAIGGCGGGGSGGGGRGGGTAPPDEPPPDGTPPVTTIALDPATADGDNGWYVSAVNVHVTATDADDATVDTRCAFDPAAPAPATFDDLPDGACAATTNVGADGEHTVIAASADTVNEEDPLATQTFKIYRTPPDLNPTLSEDPASVGLKETGVSASPHATDTTSGVASSSCDSVDTSTVGAHTLTCKAQDNAGNERTVGVPYTVKDLTPPMTTISLAPSAPNGDNGWYRSLAISVSATDPDDAVAQTVCALDPASVPGDVRRPGVRLVSRERC